MFWKSVMFASEKVKFGDKWHVGNGREILYRKTFGLVIYL
jgi:hypothetical protein